MDVRSQSRLLIIPWLTPIKNAVTPEVLSTHPSNGSRHAAVTAKIISYQLDYKYICVWAVVVDLRKRGTCSLSFCNVGRHLFISKRRAQKYWGFRRKWNMLNIFKKLNTFNHADFVSGNIIIFTRVEQQKLLKRFCWTVRYQIEDFI